MSLSRRFKLFNPILPGATLGDRLFCSFGALLGIGLTGLIGLLAFGPGLHLPFLIAPMGASAVLVFAVPASPLAQPWSVVGGNTLGAIFGIVTAALVPDPLIASGIAVALAIAGMSLARCLHPPGGAVALTAVLGGPAVAASGFSFALVPVAANSAALVALGWLFHRMSRHAYPHRHRPEPINPHLTADAPPQRRAGFDERDLDAALQDIGEAFDIDREDLSILLERIELKSLARHCGDPTCGDVMSRDLVVVTPQDRVSAAQELILRHGIRTLPVVDADRQLLGVVGLRQLGAPDELIGRVMIEAATTTPERPAFDLIPRLSDGKRHAVVVTTQARRIIGMITQTDLLAAVARRPSSDGPGVEAQVSN